MEVYKLAAQEVKLDKSEEPNIVIAIELLKKIKEQIMSKKSIKIPKELMDILTPEQKKQIMAKAQSKLTDSQRKRALTCINFTLQLLHNL